MEQIVFIEKSSRHFSKFMELLRKEPILDIRDVKRIVSHSSYYAIILKKILAINNLLRELKPNLYLAEPTFNITKTKNVYNAIKRCDLIEIEAKKDFYAIRCKNED